METCHNLYRFINQSPSASSQLPPNLHHRFRRRRYQNVRRQPSFTMPIRGPIITLGRITTAEYHFRLNHPKQTFCITNQFASLSQMAEESKIKDAVVQGKSDPKTTFNGEEKEKEKEKAPEKSTPAIPPLPEKPLPGDCCGSGCVRCVWDVYYDELEEYNRLYKDDPKVS